MVCPVLPVPSFANPAITIARALSDTFAGIWPADVVPFIGAQAAGAIAAMMIARVVFSDGQSDSVYQGAPAEKDI